jgi:acyl-CoA thioesterase
MTPWTGHRRAEIQSRIFSEEGTLLATCVQEAYYVLKDEKVRRKEAAESIKGKL